MAVEPFYWSTDIERFYWVTNDVCVISTLKAWLIFFSYFKKKTLNTFRIFAFYFWYRTGIPYRASEAERPFGGILTTPPYGT